MTASVAMALPLTDARESRPIAHGSDAMAQFVARALDGDRNAMKELVVAPDRLQNQEFSRLVPVLAVKCKQLGVDVPAQWSMILRHSVAHSLRQEWSLKKVAETLDACAIPWMPIKGMDLGSRLWDAPHLRPSTDLDVFVKESQLTDARRALEKSGWKSVHAGPEYEDYLRKEDYNWQATGPSGVLLELHFRLWSSVSREYINDVWQRSIPAPELGQCARRPSWPDAFLLCAVHLWQFGPPFQFIYFWELELMARRGDPSLNADVDALARRWGLSLQVCLAAWKTASLWDSPSLRTLAAALEPSLSLPERIVLNRARKRGSNAISLAQISAVRLLAGRETRRGWQAAFRRVWPHVANRRVENV